MASRSVGETVVERRKNMERPHRSSLEADARHPDPDVGLPLSAPRRRRTQLQLVQAGADAAHQRSRLPCRRRRRPLFPDRLQLASGANPNRNRLSDGGGAPAHLEAGSRFGAEEHRRIGRRPAKRRTLLASRLVPSVVELCRVARTLEHETATGERRIRSPGAVVGTEPWESPPGWIQQAGKVRVRRSTLSPPSPRGGQVDQIPAPGAKRHGSLAATQRLGEDLRLVRQPREQARAGKVLEGIAYPAALSKQTEVRIEPCRVSAVVVHPCSARQNDA